MTAKSLILPAALLALLAACSVLPKREPTKLYEPAHTPLVAAADWPSVQWSLLVAKPGASEALDSERISVRPTPGSVQVYQAASWSDGAPELVQAALLRGFEESQKILAVARPGSGIHGDYTLQVDLRSFESVYQGDAPQVVVEFRLRLVHVVDGEVIAARSLREVEPVAGQDVPEVVAAFSRALDRATIETVGWTLVQGQAHAARIKGK